MTRADVKRNALISVPCFAILLFILPLEFATEANPEIRDIANFTLQMLHYGIAVFMVLGVIGPIGVTGVLALSRIEHISAEITEGLMPGYLKQMIITDWMEKR